MWFTFCLAMATTTASVRFDHHLMAEDTALKGWTPAELARRAGVADMTAYRFLDGTSQTPPTAKKLARALGHSLRRYLISSRRAA